jgi:hypothetical protein
MDWILSRLNEPSTWRGMAALATALGITLRLDLIDAIVAVGLAAIGLINVVRKEGPPLIEKKYCPGCSVLLG